MAMDWKSRDQRTKLSDDDNGEILIPAVVSGLPNIALGSEREDIAVDPGVGQL